MMLTFAVLPASTLLPNEIIDQSIDFYVLLLQLYWVDSVGDEAVSRDWKCPWRTGVASAVDYLFKLFR
jgi:hypothetical protein